MPVNAWTVDDVENATRLISYGIDGIITDDVELILNLRKEYGHHTNTNDNDSSSSPLHKGGRDGDEVGVKAVIGIAFACALVGILLGGVVVGLLTYRKFGKYYSYTKLNSHPDGHGQAK